MEVILHVYDVTNSESEKTNSTILSINKIFKDGTGIGGNFHTAVQVYGSEEWSSGFCEHGSGVFSCPSTKDPMYTYRELISLGQTNCTSSMVNQILRELSRAWPGDTYDLLSRNCNHFFDDFCEKLGVQKLPGWVNHFANAGDAALKVVETAAVKLKQTKDEIVLASKWVCRFLLAGMASNSSTSTDSPNTSTDNVPRFQASWFKNLLSVGDKPSSSSNLEDSSSSSSSSSSNDELHPELKRAHDKFTWCL